MTWNGLSPPYRTIVADPPWPYEDGFPRGNTKAAARATVPLPYSAMELRNIARMPVGDLARENAWLFLWATNRYLRAAFDIMLVWGFRYTQTITWRKTGCPPPFVRSVAPQHSEFLLVGKRGTPERLQPFPSSVIDGPASPRIHSRKPDVFADLIEDCCTGPYVELFARAPRLGWDSWGYGYESAIS